MRPVVGALLAVALGAWLSLADLMTAHSENPDELRYSVVGLIGIALVIAVVRKHALWLIPVATVAFATVYETWFWTAPPEMPGGMDGIGWSPSGVIFVVPFLLPVIALMLGFAAAARRVLRRRAATA